MEQQTSLEKVGIEERTQNQLVRNEWQSVQPYDDSNDAALTHDDNCHPLGKGTGDGGHNHTTVQDYNSSTKGLMKPQFNTSDGGGSYDKYGRNNNGGRVWQLNINKYNPENDYSKLTVLTDDNVGQYVEGYRVHKLSNC